MRRSLVVSLIAALAAVSSVKASLHTHAYAGHDHPEHHHGPAAHEHQALALDRDLDRDDDQAHAESCDPGEHTVSFAFVCAAAGQLHADAGTCVTPPLAVPQLRAYPVIGPGEVRVHGPPPCSQSAPRAPPSLAHA